MPALAGKPGAGGAGRTGDVLPAPSVALTDRPLIFIKAQIDSLRALTEALDALTDARDPRLPSIRAYLSARLLAILQDRRANVLPLMVRRAAPEDDADRLQAALHATYDAVQANAEALVALLPEPGTARSLPRYLLDPARTLALHLRQMVSLEASVLVPLLRVRLTQADADLLAAAFQARRENWPDGTRAGS
ncbi:hypothetical protein CKO28_18340 [Rhodovibrio sodomensis]|uniref:Hemerythrin-like domain-containing protein n=1 Tax=Rhodovibrio sodomensis TaxID=1088 RepID=A0ABS1DJA2_9PROT|nr:hypothetical protein [Rhodovibrio sodomensis]MBK1669997.1 hypothetical protein [Rhodovibrio sodomensis]